MRRWLASPRTRIGAILAAAGILLVGCVPVPPAGPGNFSGWTLDTCDAPSSAAMQAWLSSPYRGVGIYIGGNSAGCHTQTYLSASWVSTQRSQGWNLLPLYVGSQAPCPTNPNLHHFIDPADASAQGVAEGDDAVAQAQALGIGPGSPIFFDMEGYGRAQSCIDAVRAFSSAWVDRLHAYGYAAGWYSSSSSGIVDQAAIATQGLPYTFPDLIWFANWNNKTSTFGDPFFPDSVWSAHQRHHQYQGGHTETWSGVSINIDSTISDGLAVSPS